MAATNTTGTGSGPVAETMIHNTSPARQTGGYFEQPELENYLAEQFPMRPRASFAITHAGERFNFMAPRKFTEADWKELSRRSRARRKTALSAITSRGTR